MSYDLLNEPWLKGRRASGTIERFAPPDITSKHEDPFVDILAPRADLRASLYQFLIGLLQTALEPDTERTWKKRYDAPPTPQDLARAFKPLRHAFDLQHERTPFMQELGIDAAGDPMTELIFGLPGASTTDSNKDLFIKRTRSGPLCPVCAAAALFGLQTNASGGGAGYTTSIRGGGPLSTIILGDTLWQTCWMNVLARADWIPQVPRSHDGRTFPWLGVHSSGAKRGVITLQDAAAGLHCWATPRRVLLEWRDSAESCALCSEAADRLATAVHQRPGGFQYKGSWLHPLSPSYEEDGERRARLAKRTSAGYRHWRGLVLDNSQDGHWSAPVVSHLRTARAETLQRYGGWRVSVFGLHFDPPGKDKLSGWYEATLPSFEIPEPSSRADYEDAVRTLLAGAEFARKALYMATASAANPAKPPPIDESFWRATEAAFHRALAALLHEETDVVKRIWRDEVSRAAVDVFRAAFPFASYADVDPARLARAERSLERSLRSPKMTKALEFSEPAEIAA